MSPRRGRPKPTTTILNEKTDDDERESSEEDGENENARRRCVFLFFFILFFLFLCVFSILSKRERFFFQRGRAARDRQKEKCKPPNDYMCVYIYMYMSTYARVLTNTECPPAKSASAMRLLLACREEKNKKNKKNKKKKRDRAGDAEC